MNVLEAIFARKRKELKKQKRAVPIDSMLRSMAFSRPRFLEALKKSGPSIIAEFKRVSPAKGVIRSNGKVEEIAAAYSSAGAAALSILTEKNYFSGSSDDLVTARKSSALPILRKDFIFDGYQIVETKNWGADAVLIIAAMVNDKKLSSLLQACRRWELDAVVEVHTKSEVERALAFGADIIGVNNRDLKSLKVDLRVSYELAGMMDGRTVFISESGIESPQTAAELYRLGYKGFLIGSYFMRQPNPGEALKNFLKEVEALTVLKVKICGLTNLKDALLAEELGADMLGFIFYPKSSRYLFPAKAAAIISRLSPFTRKVGVFVNEKPEKVLRIARKLKLDFVQLSGEESPAFVKKIQREFPVIKAFRVGEDFKLSTVKDSPANLRLVDSSVGGFYGGSGRSFDWKKISFLKGDSRLVLAGGLGAENIREAYEKLRPAAVDLTSSVEFRPGKKDPAKLKKFFEVVNELRRGL